MGRGLGRGCSPGIRGSLGTCRRPALTFLSVPDILGSNHGQDKGRSSPSPTGSMIISAGEPAGLPGLRGSDSIPPHSVCG